MKYSRTLQKRVFLFKVHNQYFSKSVWVLCKNTCNRVSWQLLVLRRPAHILILVTQLWWVFVAVVDAEVYDVPNTLFPCEYG